MAGATKTLPPYPATPRQELDYQCRWHLGRLGQDVPGKQGVQNLCLHVSTLTLTDFNVYTISLTQSHVDAADIARRGNWSNSYTEVD